MKKKMMLILNRTEIPTKFLFLITMNSQDPPRMNDLKQFGNNKA